MGYIIYAGLGIVAHLIMWGGEWYGLYSIAMLVFWPVMAIAYLIPLALAFLILFMAYEYGRDQYWWR